MSMKKHNKNREREMEGGGGEEGEREREKGPLNKFTFFSPLPKLMWSQ